MEQLAEIEALRDSIVLENRKVASQLKLSGDPKTSPTVLEWNGTRYIVRPGCVDQLTFHMYFALQLALNIHREKKEFFDPRHLRFMIALASVIRCGSEGKKGSEGVLCTSECKTYGL